MVKHSGVWEELTSDLSEHDVIQINVGRLYVELGHVTKQSKLEKALINSIDGHSMLMFNVLAEKIANQQAENKRLTEALAVSEKALELLCNKHGEVIERIYPSRGMVPTSTMLLVYTKEAERQLAKEN